MMKRTRCSSLSTVALLAIGGIFWATLARSESATGESALAVLGRNDPPEITVPVNPFVRDALVGLRLLATVRDDGYPLPTDVVQPLPDDPNKLRWRWTVVAIPPNSEGILWSGSPSEGEAFTYQNSPNPPGTIFTCDPTATFDVPGKYTLEFNAGDGAEETSQRITVFVKSTTEYRALGYQYLCPLPGAEYTSPQTRFILVRFTDISPFDVTNLSTFITVTDDTSGHHPGNTRIASDGRTVLYEMLGGFLENQLITVRLAPEVSLSPDPSGIVRPYQYQFMISGHLPDADLAALDAGSADDAGVPDPAAVAVSVQSQERGLGASGVPAAAPGQVAIMPNGVSVPSDFPQAVVTISKNPSPGYLFLMPDGVDGGQYSMILDNDGSPVWYQRDGGRNFTVQDNGTITSSSVAYDQNFNLLKRYYASNGYDSDFHDFKLREDGSYVMIGLREETLDMTRYFPDGDPVARAETKVVQAYTAAGELVFQWRAWDHFDVRNLRGSDPRASYFNFPHMNAVDVDDDGHILVSSRNLSEVTKINCDTGEIIWRLSGVHSDFAFVNDPLDGFSNQHAITALGQGHYLLFDNGNLHSPPVSRAVEYQLDLTHHTATLVWEFRDTPDKFSYFMGNAQRLTNGNTLVNFAMGNYPKPMEVDSHGVKQFEMTLVPNSHVYRVFRYPWTGVVARPYLMAELESENVVLVFNKFGDHAVNHYRIYGGTSPAPTQLLATSATTLFRPQNVVKGSSNYFRVTAVSTLGVESDYSNEESLFVPGFDPGQNRVFNGDFSQATSGWFWRVVPPASAQWNLENEESHFVIANAGTYISDVQLGQRGISLVQGMNYVFEFDGWAVQPRIFEAQVTDDGSPAVNYSRIQPFYLTPVPSHYRFTFTMSAPSDFEAVVVFNTGVMPVNGSLDNVSLRQVSPGDFDLDGDVDDLDLAVLTGEWMKKQGGLKSDLNGDGQVNFLDYAIFAQNWSGENNSPPENDFQTHSKKDL